jgi:predicted MFS family arabinose efflux permease
VRSDRGAVIGRERRMRLMSLFYLAAVPFPLIFVWAPGVTAVAASVFLFSLFRTMGSANEHPVLCDVVEPRLRSTAIGIANLANCLAGGAATFLAGYVKHYFGLGTVFSFISVLLLVAALLAWWGYKNSIHSDLEEGAQYFAQRH